MRAYLRLLHFFFFLGLAACQPTMAQKKSMIIVLDPGHGGVDVGKERSRKDLAHEKTLNLEIALKLGKLIKEDLPNAKVYYTRMSDTALSLDERVAIANRNRADLFISIHCNSLPIRDYHGTQTHIHSKKFKSSYQLAQAIEEAFADAGRRSRGVKDWHDRGHNLQVLQYTEMPSLLIECGFMSNPEEEEFLNGNRGQNKIAKAINNALQDHLKKPLPPEDRESYMRVQLAASPKKLDTSTPRFEKMNMRIEEQMVYVKGAKSYVYLIGREYETASVNALCARAKRIGFPDAKVVSIGRIARYSGGKRAVVADFDEKPSKKEDKKEEKKTEMAKSGNAKPSEKASPKAQPQEGRTYFRIQICSSQTQLDLGSREFTRLGQKVEVFENTDRPNSFRYQYTVGKAYGTAELKPLLAEVRKKGFPDAFFIQINPKK